MEILKRCKDSFRPVESSYGAKLYVEGGVTRVVLEGSVAAGICYDGSRRFAMAIDFVAADQGRVLADCECGKCHTGRLCPHVCALLWELDERGASVPGQGKLSTQHGIFNQLLTFARTILAQPKSNAKGDAPAFNIGPLANQHTDSSLLPATRSSSWKSRIDAMRLQLSSSLQLGQDTSLELATAPDRQLWFVLLIRPTSYAGILQFALYESERRPNGAWSLPRLDDVMVDDERSDSLEEQVLALADLDERDIELKTGSKAKRYAVTTLQLNGPNTRALLELMSQTGRCVWTDRLEPELDLSAARPLVLDAGAPWRVILNAQPESSDDGRVDFVRWTPELHRDEQVRDLAEVVAPFENGYVLWPDQLACLKPGDAEWVATLKRQEPIIVPRDELDTFLERFTELPNVPELNFATELGVETQVGQPRGRLTFERHSALDQRRLGASILFRYGDREFTPDDVRETYWDDEQKCVGRRGRAAEAELLKRLSPFGFQLDADDGLLLTVSPAQLPQLVMQITQCGWEVFAEGLITRSPSASEWRVSSGTDWFDLHVELEFDGIRVGLPELLQAIRDRRNYVQLDDGSRGLLPEAWLRRYSLFTEIGEGHENSLRFEKSQALLLDVLLAEQQNVKTDINFSAFCRKLKSFAGVRPQREPPTFQGELREYQRIGLGWFQFLEEFDFGGCLADDMGLGKTVQVLALLEHNRTRSLPSGQSRLPSLAVVPKSLVFNWMDEAQRFAPELRVLNYTGTERALYQERLDDFDLVITTYGTLRRDIAELKDRQFECVILDESQAIKNAQSQAAKSCRLLKGRRRLAMTGTPIENHLGELWSLFEFLNPGIFGKSERFRQATRAGSGLDTEALEMLSKAIQPFMLRRTKQQVLSELPEKTEQTLFCEMSSKQHKVYTDLRDHYRTHLSRTLKAKGLSKSKIHVLEALLRLRQAACDPRLLDDRQPAGAKIELLMEHLAEVREGHKVLVFSQFTSLLALLRQELDARDWTYEYLDGKTRNRAQKVQRFQEDPACSLFLISLKAGGQGLNLTAADYVYILDPWWNPAVEAQAIDRAHRIGQQRPVMAYRIICRDTVEEKILELQASKRKLADAIITANESIISKLSADDLQFLLS